MNWYTLFRQHILDRGIEYYEDGNVVDFQCTEDSISAHVDGTDIYDVEIMIEGEEVIDMYCSCPYARMLKALVKESESWNQIVCEIVNTNPYEYFVCDLLFEEKRYEELISKIEKSSNRVDLVDIYEKSLRKRMPKQVIEIYESYIIEEAERAYDRKGYSRLMPYLKKISRCEGGDVVARGIADSWKQKYKRRSAMMDELKKAGF